MNLGLNLSNKRTRKRDFLEEMDQVVWTMLVQIVEPFPIETMLRIHYLPQWFGLSDPAMEYKSLPI